MNAVDFPPARQRGVTLHLIMILLLAGITTVGVWQATLQPVGPVFSLYILAAAIAFLPIPTLIYRLWALMRARYILDRDSLTITWGLRVERIPVSDVEWVRSRQALKEKLPLPPLCMPGSILGARRTAELGTVEFLASEARSILLVATRGHILAISPADPQAFLQNIQRAIEMGSLSPAQAQSVYPAFLVIEAWKNRLARFFWLAGLFTNIGILLWVGLLIPSLGNISLGFMASGGVREASPGYGLLLVPVISLIVFVTGWLAGIFVYRRPELRVLASFIWANSLVVSLLFLGAILFIVTTPV